jgi:hypothetical protein
MIDEFLSSSPLSVKMSSSRFTRSFFFLAHAPSSFCFCSRLLLIFSLLVLPFALTLTQHAQSTRRPSLSLHTSHPCPRTTLALFHHRALVALHLSARHRVGRVRRARRLASDSAASSHCPSVVTRCLPSRAHVRHSAHRRRLVWRVHQHSGSCLVLHTSAGLAPIGERIEQRTRTRTTIDALVFILLVAGDGVGHCGGCDRHHLCL